MHTFSLYHLLFATGLLKSSPTIGFHERELIREQIDKKQQEIFRAQKKYFQAQSAQFADKEKRVADLKGKLKMNFEISRIATVQFNIIS